jgi:hypothetical protein
MPMTTIKVEHEVRDALARVAADELGGATLNAALVHLLTEHRKAAVHAAYAKLAADPEKWAEYQAELAEWDAVAGDAAT